MDIFRNTKFKNMPEYLFSGAVYLDHDSAIKGDPSKQNFTVCARPWYIDANFVCEGCSKEFTWTALEQKVWFENYFFWIDSQPRCCKNCYRIKRQLATLQKEYNAIVADAKLKGNRDLKKRVIVIVIELETAFTNLPLKMTMTRELFQKQLTKS